MGKQSVASASVPFGSPKIIVAFSLFGVKLEQFLQAILDFHAARNDVRYVVSLG